MNIYERDALNAAFENIDSLVDTREVGMKMTNSGSRFGYVPSQHMGCFGEVQVDPKNCGDSLNSIRDDSGEVGMKLLTGCGYFGE